MILPLAKSSGCISCIVSSVPIGFSLALLMHYSCQWLPFSPPHSQWWPSNVGWEMKVKEEGRERIKSGEWENHAKGGGGAWQRGRSVDHGMWRKTD